MTGKDITRIGSAENLSVEVSETTYKMLQAYDALKLRNLERNGSYADSKISSALNSMYEVLRDLLANDLLGGY